MNNRSPVSQSSAWTLYHTKPDGTFESWGTVWMSDTELNKTYQWKNKRWVHRTDKTKFLEAVSV